MDEKDEILEGESSQLDPSDFEEDEVKETEGKGSEDKTPEDEEAKKEKEEKAKNAKFAEMRRKREAEAKAKSDEEAKKANEKRIRDEATLKAELGVIKKNPYTEEPIVDEQDLKVYKLQREIEENGGDPIADLPKKIAEENRKIAKSIADEASAKKAKEDELQKRIQSEIKELKEKFPNIDTKEVADDKDFNEVFEEKGERWTLAEKWAEAVRRKEARKEAETLKDVNDKSKRMTSVPSSTVSNKSGSKKISEMTKEEFDAYWKSL